MLLILTKKQSESQFGLFMLLTTVIVCVLLLLTNTWSVWFTSLVPGITHVPLWIFLCWNFVLTIINRYISANETSLFPFSLVDACRVYLPATSVILSSFPTLALKSPKTVFA